MKHYHRIAVAALAAIVLAGGALVRQAQAADASEEAIKKFMKDCHKAPKGVDPVCKKAGDGQATAEEIKKLVAGYKMMAAAKPPRGDEASWKEKTAKLVAASEGLAKHAPDAPAKFKEAVNCKACHSVHKPE